MMVVCSATLPEIEQMRKIKVPVFRGVIFVLRVKILVPGQQV